MYQVFLLYVLFLRSLGHDSQWTYTEYLKNMSNFIPLKSVYIFLTTPFLSAFVVVDFLKNVVGNIVIFIPWGFFIPFYFKNLRTSKPFVIITLIALLLIESVQLFTMLGIFDIEDIILNLVGAYIGFLCYRKLL